MGGIKVEVYKNLRKHCWSIRDLKTGKVIAHCNSIYLKDAKLVVRPAGRAKVLDTKQKNVHAFIRGQVDHSKEGWIKNRFNSLAEVKYNPYENETFIKINSDGTSIPIHEVDQIYLDSNGQVFLGAR